MKRIIAKRTLREFWVKHADSEQYLKTWYEMSHNKQVDTNRYVQWRIPSDK